ncbi:MAG: cobalt transporter CbiM [Rudaea sp.]
MHIPDGYLSPQTAAAMYAASLPFWWRASRKVKDVLSGRSVPLLALFAAFSFVIMMFNIPLPGGTTAHAVGSTLAAIVLGPWAAILTTTIALIIQAFFFGDGGILAIGANVFNMAIAMPLSGYAIYRLLSGTSPAGSRRRLIAAAAAGYLSINVSALLTAVELGVQPLLFRDAAGHALYFPYPLSVALPAMLLPHLTLAGLAEAASTALVLAWLQRSNLSLIERSGTPAMEGSSGVLRWGWIALIVLMVLTPLGLIAPGTAWGEWSREQLQSLGLGYIPAGFDRFSSMWRAPFSGYHVPVLDNPTVTYMLSALFGVALIVIALFLLGWIVERAAQSRSRRVAASPQGPAAAGAETGRGPGSATRFLEKTLGDISGALEQTLFAEEIARQPGLLQSLDPRVKLLGTLAFLLAVSISHSLPVILGLYLLTLPLAARSRVPLGFYLKRVWMFMPFFTGIIALPAMFNVFTPGSAALTLIDLASPRLYLAITVPGLVTAAFLLVRVGASVSAAVLLILTTRWALLLRSLRVLRVPRAFVLIMGMTYRYIYLLLHAMNDMFLARKSRVVGWVSPAEDRRWLAASMGTLLARSYLLSDEVYLAMQSRGFRGEVQVLDPPTWRAVDWLWLVLFLAVAVAAVWLGR